MKSPTVTLNLSQIDNATREQMDSPRWRISNIYTIQSRDAAGADAGPIPFVPTPEQQEVIDDIYLRGLQFLLIIKSRQLGLSTVVCIIIIDALLFGDGVQASIVDKTRADAEKKLDSKVTYAFEALPDHLRKGWRVIKDNDGEFRIRLVGGDKSTESTVYAAITARGGTNHILFISEWGEVQHKDPKRSREILTGSLPSADHPGCVTIVETTWKGGRTGDLWPLVDGALKIPEAVKTPKDARVRFYGWWTNPNNTTDGPAGQITTKTHEYCDRAEKLINRKLTPGQRLWWQRTKEKLGIHMSSEHPTTLDECLDSPLDDAFFDAEGLAHQHSNCVGHEHEIKFGDIVLQDNGIAHWKDRDVKQALFMMIEPPMEGERYILFADFCGRRMSEGATGERDTNAFGIIKDGKIDPETRVLSKPQVVCCCMPEDRSNTPETMQRIKALYHFYGDCMTAVEINNKDDIAMRLMAIGVTNQWRQGRKGADNALPGRKKTTEVYGWFTSPGGGGTRKQMLDHMQQLTVQQEWDCGFHHIHAQMVSFITNEDGKPEAAGDGHDDWVMGPGIGLFCLPAATPYVNPHRRILEHFRGAQEEPDRIGI